MRLAAAARLSRFRSRPYRPHQPEPQQHRDQLAHGERLADAVAGSTMLHLETRRANGLSSARAGPRTQVGILMMIRQSVEIKLRAALRVPPVLIPEDFSIGTEEEKYGGVNVKIVYVGAHGETFGCTIPREKTERNGGEDFKIGCRINPGELTASERIVVWGMDELVQAVRDWAKRIAEDLQHAPAFRAIRNQQTQVETLEEKLEQYAEALPTAAEVQRIRDMISAVETALRERIEQLDEDAKKRDARLKSLAEEFEALRQRVETTKVRSMMRALAIRAYNAASDPRLGALLENGGKVVGLLTGGMGPGSPGK